MLCERIRRENSRKIGFQDRGHGGRQGPSAYARLDHAHDKCFSDRQTPKARNHILPLERIWTISIKAFLERKDLLDRRVLCLIHRRCLRSHSPKVYRRTRLSLLAHSSAGLKNLAVFWARQFIKHSGGLPLCS